MGYPIVLDLETKKTFREETNPAKLGISVVGVYDYKDRMLKAFFEDELGALFTLLEGASTVIGFNIDSFDMAVLQGYYPGNISQFKTFDILEDIRSILGRRLALNDLVSATLNKRKSGHGLQAIEYYKEGQLDKLKKYCMDDVSLTHELFEYGVSEKKIYYMNAAGKQSFSVSWAQHIKQNKAQDISLTLPF